MSRCRIPLAAMPTRAPLRTGSLRAAFVACRWAPRAAVPTEPAASPTFSPTPPSDPPDDPSDEPSDGRPDVPSDVGSGLRPAPCLREGRDERSGLPSVMGDTSGCHTFGRERPDGDADCRTRAEIRHPG